MIEPQPRARPSLHPALRAAYQRLVEERVGLRLSEQQVRGLGETVVAVLATSGEALTPDGLYAFFAQGGRTDLFDALAARLTIGETHFFRVTPQIAALREVVLPELLARRAGQRRLALWSAGCSSGEEPYTLAILLRELLPAIEEWHLHLFATDLNEAALAEARQACYREWSFRETPEQVRRAYFAQQGDSWHLHDSIRRMVRFGRLNLIADRFPVPGTASTGLDLIVCRNVTIYFSPPTTQRLYKRFADALAPDGWLVLGPSDPAPSSEIFDAVYLPNAVLWRKRATQSQLPHRGTAPHSGAPAPQRHGAGASGTRRPQQRPRALVAAPLKSPQSAAAVPAAPSTSGFEAQLAEVGALMQAGGREAARARLAHLVRSEPLAAAAHRLLGFLALEDNQPTAALESLRRATFLAADDPLAQFGLGYAYRALGDEGRARAAFRQARRILALWPGDRVVPGEGGLVAADLRAMIDAQRTITGDSQPGSA